MRVTTATMTVITLGFGGRFLGPVPMTVRLLLSVPVTMAVAPRRARRRAFAMTMRVTVAH